MVKGLLIIISVCIFVLQRLRCCLRNLNLFGAYDIENRIKNVNLTSFRLSYRQDESINDFLRQITLYTFLF